MEIRLESLAEEFELIAYTYLPQDHLDKILDKIPSLNLYISYIVSVDRRE